jgi:hypothetical protein
MKSVLLATFSAFLLSGVARAAPCEVVLSTGAGGAVASGSKALLVEAVRKGRPVRVGWELDFDKNGEADLIHWAEATFLTIFEGEVMAQIAPIHRQHPKRGTGHATLSADFELWHALIGTKGLLEHRFDSAKAQQTPVNTTWCAA